MRIPEILNGFVTKAISQGRGFALWFLPDDPEINALVQNEGSLSILENLSGIDHMKGFVFSPFVADEKHPSFILQSERFLKGFEEIDDYAKAQKAKSSAIHQSMASKTHSTKKSDYLESCQLLIDRIKSGEASKVVLSRIKVSSNHLQKKPARLLLDLHANYPGAFCYMFFTVPTGLWMGASPETLLRKSGETIRTMALAGTRKCMPENNISHPWPEKDIREQQFVSDYIQSKLEKIGIHQLQISKPFTHQAGTIEHIRTDFTFSVDANKNILGQLIETLHPTPAVCGQPGEKALQMIRETEMHHREYYAGFLGPVNLDKQTDLFVNLRCMKMIGTNFVLYIGGGITADSVAKNEWIETEMKAGILEQVLGRN